MGSREKELWFAEYSSRIRQRAPAFEMNAQEARIRCIESPGEFYKSILCFASKCKRRIALSTLYLGSGSMEMRIVEEIHRAARARPELKVDVLMDYSRAIRKDSNGINAVHLLKNTLECRNMQVFLFQPPRISALGRFASGKLGEVLGVQHMKFYIFDDHVILSGANLSQIYFTNRQDRYLVIRNEGLADYLHSLLLTVGKHSFTAMDDTSLQLSKFSGHHPCKNPTEFTHAFLEDISSFTSPSTTKVPVKDASKPVIDTIIFPTLQLGNCGLNHDKSITEEIISWNLKQTRLRIASGYMNFPISYLDLFSKSQGSLELYTCSPEANGFHSGKGILKYIPDLYLDIAQRTSNHIDNAAKSKQVFEYYRQGWTFHSKGLWLSPAGIDKPILSSIGSPNFGHRSICRDLEAHFFVVTKSSRLLNDLELEYRSLTPFLRPLISSEFAFINPLIRIASRAFSSIL